MKLATAFTGRGTALYVGRNNMYYDVSGYAQLLGIADLVDVYDVGEYLRRGDSAQVQLSELLDELSGEGSAGVETNTLRLAPPIISPDAIVCIGRNYAEHIREGGAPTPEFPILFSKYKNALIGHKASVAYPTIANQLDYEGELLVVIGRETRRVAARDAWNCIAGYSIINDISARDLQASDIQWIRGKTLDDFAPTGPIVVTCDEIEDVDALRIQTRINGELRQDQPCSDMIFKIPELIEFISAGITLQPGDLIATGTPSGCAIGLDPPQYLRPGDVMEVTIDPIGTLRTIVGDRLS